MPSRWKTRTPPANTAFPSSTSRSSPRTSARTAPAATSNGNGLYETPLGNGKLQFGIQPGGSSNFGSVFGPRPRPIESAQSSRQEFDRRLAPPTSLEFNGVR